MLAVATGAANLTRAMRSLEALFLIGVEGVTEIWLVRHADPYDDLVYIADPPLSARGRDQAKRLAERIKRAEPVAIYSSPYLRALETARFLSDDVHVDERLVEIPLELTAEGSFDLKETPDTSVGRMRAAIDDMVANHTGKRVVAVGHGAAIVACLTDVLRLEPGQLRLLPYYTSISVVRVLGDRVMAGGLCDTAHLV